jgi:hypothetical protein
MEAGSVRLPASILLLAADVFEFKTFIPFITANCLALRPPRPLRLITLDFIRVYLRTFAANRRSAKS